MAILIYRDRENRYWEQEFSERVRIGSDPVQNEVVLPADWNVAPTHVVITRSVMNRLPVLVDLSGQYTRVNGRRVVRVQVLRHGDKLQLGQARLTMWEVRITRLRAGDRAIGRECPVCTVGFEVEDEVIVCPRCRTVHHRDCWFSIPICAYYGCEYPIHETVMDVLSPWVGFERRLEEGSELVEVKKDDRVVKEGMVCQAGNRRDQVPFQLGHKVAYCPSCDTPYHLECWLALDQCPICSHDVRSLIDQVFLAGHSE